MEDMKRCYHASCVGMADGSLVMVTWLQDEWKRGVGDDLAVSDQKPATVFLDGILMPPFSSHQKHIYSDAG
jgi:hypothetical protein